MSAWEERRNGQPSRGRRRGRVFSVRVTDEERGRLDAMQAEGGGPRSIGPWLVWRALRGHAGTTAPAGYYPLERVLPGPRRVLPGPGTTRPGGGGTTSAPPIILDLCAGSGSWSEPYERAGYDVRKVTLPAADVRTFVPPPNVHGVLAAPPCTEFSLAKNGQPRDFVEGMACVNACLRIILQARPAWWALENPTGYLGEFLGTARDTFEPCDFGDPWTKRTALWGEFRIPERGPFIEPKGSAMDRPTAALRAVTPPGFARAFFLANP